MLPPSALATSPTKVTRRAKKRYALCYLQSAAVHEPAWQTVQEEANLWDFDNWLHDAQQRTREYYEGRSRGPLTWILVDGRNIPTNIAIPGGEERGAPHYICRGFHEVSG